MPKKPLGLESELSVERPYGGRIILRADRQAEGLAAFFTWASHWFAQLPEELSLLPVSPQEQAERERASLMAIAAEHVPVGTRVHLDYEPTTPMPSEARVPIAGDTFRASAAFERRSVTNYIISRPDERFNTSTGLAVTHIEGDRVARVEMRPSNAQSVLSERDLKKIQEVANRLSPFDDDLLDILIANVRENGVNLDGVATIALVDVIETRELGVAHRKTRTGALHRDGIRREALDEVYERLLGLETLYVYVGQDVVKGRAASAWDRVFTIRRLLTDEEDPSRVVGIQYEFGRSAAWHTADVIAPARLLQLNAGKRGPVKKVGRYFIQRAPEADHEGRVVRNVQVVLAELHRPFDEDNPARARRWLESTLDELVAEQIIGTWGYLESQGSKPNLPRYGWSQQWLGLHLYVELSRMAKDAPGAPDAASSL